MIWPKLKFLLSCKWSMNFCEWLKSIFRCILCNLITSVLCTHYIKWIFNFDSWIQLFVNYKIFARNLRKKRKLLKNVLFLFIINIYKMLEFSFLFKNNNIKLTILHPTCYIWHIIKFNSALYGLLINSAYQTGTYSLTRVPNHYEHTCLNLDSKPAPTDQTTYAVHPATGSIDIRLQQKSNRRLNFTKVVS